MKILIAPTIFQSKCDASWHLASNLADLFSAENHAVAISAPENAAVRHASLYPCVLPREPLFKRRSPARTYEEWLYKNGCLQKKYLEEDLNKLLEVIDTFQPDLIISILRPMAEAAAQIHNIRCFSYVHPVMYSHRKFPTDIIYPLNQILSDQDLVQIISLKDLLMRDELRFGFGPERLMPYLSEQKVLRLGSETAVVQKAPHTNRVCIFLNDVKKSPKQMKEIIIDAFHGAPYAVYASFNGSSSSTEENIHFLTKPRPSLIPGSIAVIHDGNDYYTNLCLVKGIVQVIVSNHDFIRLYNGNAVERTKTGKRLFEEDLDMSSLYNTYRTILSDDQYDINCKTIKKEISQYGDLSELLHLI